jgi:hypothetical protein
MISSRFSRTELDEGTPMGGDASMDAWTSKSRSTRSWWLTLHLCSLVVSIDSVAEFRVSMGSIILRSLAPLALPLVFKGRVVMVNRSHVGKARRWCHAVQQAMNCVIYHPVCNFTENITVMHHCVIANRSPLSFLQCNFSVCVIYSCRFRSALIVHVMRKKLCTNNNSFIYR